MECILLTWCGLDVHGGSQLREELIGFSHAQYVMDIHFRLAFNAFFFLSFFYFVFSGMNENLKNNHPRMYCAYYMQKPKCICRTARRVTNNMSRTKAELIEPFFYSGLCYL